MVKLGGENTFGSKKNFLGFFLDFYSPILAKILDFDIYETAKYQLTPPKIAKFGQNGAVKFQKNPQKFFFRPNYVFPANFGHFGDFEIFGDFGRPRSLIFPSRGWGFIMRGFENFSFLLSVIIVFLGFGPIFVQNQLLFQNSTQ